MGPLRQEERFWAHAPVLDPPPVSLTCCNADQHRFPLLGLLIRQLLLGGSFGWQRAFRTVKNVTHASSVRVLSVCGTVVYFFGFGERSTTKSYSFVCGKRENSVLGAVFANTILVLYARSLQKQHHATYGTHFRIQGVAWHRG